MKILFVCGGRDEENIIYIAQAERWDSSVEGSMISAGLSQTKKDQRVVNVRGSSSDCC